MGTTLTGTTPQDTYDSLIKVTDNGPISGTLKALSDGLGNDSTLSLSTTAASIAGTLAVSGNATFDTNTLFVDSANNRVGVGTTAPNTTLSVVTSGAESTISPIVTAQTSTVTYGGLYAVRDGAGDQRGLVLQTYEANVGLAEKVRITSTGNVGIGTTAPASKLHVQSGALQVSGNSIDTVISYSTVGIVGTTTAHDLQIIRNSVEIARVTANGITFNGDTAAANALDDYEEGTWTMGVEFGGASAGVTYADRTGTYTKIGRQVTVNGYLNLTNKGSSTGSATITGLPFTIPNLVQNYAAANIFLVTITFANQFQAIGAINSTSISLEEITVLGTNSTITDADFANGSQIVLSFTYFV
jgi:hypothetical protein